VKKKGGGVRLNGDRCIGCGNCVEACIVRAVFWDSETNKPMICVQCGFCVDYCPHGVIELQEKEDRIDALG
jgi:NAD-dependent dihydropyrimidine dehydrogenase PreA subunit